MPTIEHQASTWVTRQALRPLTDAEHAALHAWLHADRRHHGAYARAMAIHNAIALGTAAPMPAALAANEPAQPLQRPRRTWLRWGALAAGAAGLALLGGAGAGTSGWPSWQLGATQAVLTTAKGEFRKVPLQDKSIAEINSASRIEVRFSDTVRQVRLRRGEAWFDVAKDKSKPFIVESGDARIRAVGTAFAVRRYPHGTEVLVTEGTVQIWNQNGRAARQLLTVGERAFLANTISVERQPQEVRRKLAWREGKLVLRNQTLGEAVADFNRYSSKTIILRDPHLSERRLIGQYQLDAPELFARDVSTVLDVPLAISADTIYIGRRQPR